MKKLAAPMQMDEYTLRFNARVFPQTGNHGEKELVLTMEKRLILCEKNIDFFRKLIYYCLLQDKQIVAMANISFNDKTKTLSALKQFGVEIIK